MYKVKRIKRYDAAPLKKDVSILPGDLFYKPKEPFFFKDVERADSPSKEIGRPKSASPSLK